MKSAKASAASFVPARFDIRDDETVVRVDDKEDSRVVRSKDETDTEYYTRVRVLMTEKYMAPKYIIECTGSLAARDALVALSKHGASELRPGVRETSEAQKA